ncbi:MAG: hypothetical protein ABSE73_04630 [Planctomycetota bacterium]
MAGFADAGNEVYGAAPAGRWLVPLAFALLVHCVPMFCLSLSGTPALSDDFTVTVEFADDAGERPEAANPAEPPSKTALSAAKTLALPSGAPEIEKAPDAPAAKPELPRAPEAAVLLAPVAGKSEEKPKLKILDLEPLLPAPGVAFDESKSTKKAPKEGYLSDRTSTAADHGPKNLPRGDPYMDKGESKAIRYQERRGEGNMPPIASLDTSGSVKKEGNPDAGHGAPDLRPPDAKPPLKAQVQPAPVEEQKLPAGPGLPMDPKTTERGPEPFAVAQTKEIQAGARTGSQALDGPGLVAVPAPAAKAEPVETPPPRHPQAAERRPAPAAARTPEPLQKAPAPLDELEAFAALLDGKGSSAGRGGDTGAKTGVHARPGEKGHEGDGTLRPGHDEAVSDVTTINLDSSAADDDDARFAKVFDPKTAYVKPLARRIDGKWKTERVARNRWRPLHGVVTFKIIVRKDGKLLSATEAARSPKDLPDEYAASAKIAIERAADPLSEPFPPALAQHDTLEFAFNFLY